MQQKPGVLQKTQYFASRVYYYAYFQLDRLLSYRVNPANTVVISGFRRSGTTWLQQSLATILQAKTIFEPLNPLNPEVPKMYKTWPVTHKQAGFLELYMPYWAVSGETNSPPPHENFPGHIKKALTGNLCSRWARHVHQPNTLLKNQIILKFTRGQLCIRGIHNHFGCPTIHLTRDPRAVLASLKMVGWDGIFDELCLQHQLLDQADGRATYFDQWRDLILDYDQRDKMSKIAAYWALSENFVRSSFADQPIRNCRISYEDLVRQPNLVYKILDTIKVDYPHQGSLDFMRDDSRTTAEQRHGISVEERIFGWRKKLSATEIALINLAAADFDLNDTLVEE